MKKLAISLAAVLIAAIIALHFAVEERRKNVMQLSQLAAAGNARLPVMVDDVTRMDSVVAHNYTLQFSYTIFSEADAIDIDQLERSVRDWFRESACGNEVVRDKLLSKDIPLVYRYRSATGEPVAQYAFGAADCQGPVGTSLNRP